MVEHFNRVADRNKLAILHWRASIDFGRLFIGLAFLVLFTVIFLIPSSHGNAVRSPVTIQSLFGVPLTIILTMVLLVLFGLRFHSKLYGNTARLTLIGIVAAGSVLGMRLDDWMPHRMAVMPVGWAELAAVTTGAAIVTLMIDARTALLCTATLVVFGGFLTAQDGPGQLAMAYTSAATMGSALIAIYSFHRLQSRTAIVQGALTVVIGNAVICALLQFACRQDLYHIGRALLFTVVASSGAIVCFFSGVALLEKPLGITTYLGLLELSDLNRPLLRLFCLEAPGSYAHSMMVANLAAGAAEAIGCNALLARVGAYYHDVGKLRRAEFFIENQSGHNLHETMTPSLSAVVLKAHVREGLAIAESEHLPPAIKDIIEQHHGTSLIKYFYDRATSGFAESECNLLEERFRYPGPRPQSKEAAIVMLADSVEAASHTLIRPTAARVEELVEGIMSNLIADGQLDESTLLIRDIAAIKSSFIHLLCGIMHRRIEYPGMTARNIENAPPLRYGRGSVKAPGLFARDRQAEPVEHETTASTKKLTEDTPSAVPASASLSLPQNSGKDF